MDRKADRRIKTRRTMDGKRTDRVKKAERERMLRLRNQDKTIEEIALELDRSERTVSKQLAEGRSQTSQKEVDPLVQEAKREHLSEIRNLIQEWRTALRTPEKLEGHLHLNELWAQGIPTHGVENNRLFECVRGHLPFSTLWQDYSDWVKKYLDFLDKNRSLVRQFGEELLGCEGVLRLSEGCTAPLILRISGSMQRAPRIEKEISYVKDKQCEILWDGDYRILYANDALACGELYKKISTRFLYSEGNDIRILLHELKLLECKIQTSLQEILLKRDYINYACGLCPDLSVRQ